MVNIPSKVLWLRAGALANLPDGAAVSAWPDESGNGNNAIQATASRQPIFKASSINGNAAVRYDGVDDVLGLTGTTKLNNISLFMVYLMEPGATAGYYPIVLGGFPDIAGLYYAIETRNPPSGDSPDVLDVMAGYSNDARATSPGISSFGKALLVSTITTGKIHDTTVRVNGADAIMSTTGSNLTLDVQIGEPDGKGLGGVGGRAGNEPPYSNFKGDIAEVLVFNSVLSTDQRACVESYLNGKYAIYP